MVKLHPHMQTISILKQGIMLYMHTQVCTHTHVPIDTPTYPQKCFHHLLLQKNNVISFQLLVEPH